MEGVDDECGGADGREEGGGEEARGLVGLGVA